MMGFGKIIQLLRDIWVIFGITILLFVLLETCLSAAFFLKDHFIPADSKNFDQRMKADTYNHAPWVKKYYVEFLESYTARWMPYVYWHRKAYKGDYININSDGIRVTPHSYKSPQKSDVRELNS